MKVKELRTENLGELERKIVESRQKYMELRFQHASGTLKNPLELRNIRKDIAKILTIIKEKQDSE